MSSWGLRWPAFVVAGLMLGALPAFAQDEGGDTEPQPTYQFPGPFEATAQARQLEAAADAAEREIAVVGDVDDLEASLDQMRARISELGVLTTAVSDAEYMRPERMSRVRDRALQHQQRLEGLRDRAIESVSRLDELRAGWSERRQYWVAWRQALSGDERLELVQEDFNRAVTRAEEILAAIDDVLPEVVRVQNETASLHTDVEQTADYIATLRAGRRDALTERTEPVLVTPAFFQQLTGDIPTGWRPHEAVVAAGHFEFIRSNILLLVLHGLLILLVLFVVRRVRGHTIPEGAWSGLLLRPRALAVFAVTAVLSDRYSLAPALWDVILWALLAGSAAVLATRLVRNRSLRLMVYVFAGLYPLFLFAEAILTPAPLFRLFLGGAAVGGLLAFGLLLRQEVAQDHPNAWARSLLGLGMLMWFVVLAAEVLGFYPLARWMLHATVSSLYVIFVVTFLMVTARGAVATLMRIETGGRLGFLKTVGVPLVERLLRLFQIALVIIAGLHILDVWELAVSPVETWRSIMGVGFTLGSVEITLGRILMAGILVYVAILISWVLRTVARTEVYPHWEMERGVGDSINALVHYFLITIGFLIALGALGVELQNFAIVAGALGVGIGFGLQNIVNNFVSGLILLFERPVRSGDTVVIGSELGTIQKIGLRSTTVLTFDQAEVIVPNADLVSEKVTNWTLSNSSARLIMPVGVAYGSDVQRVLELLAEASDKHPEVLSQPPPQILFTEFGDSSLEFELRVWVADLRRRLIVRSEILAKIDRLFREAGIEIPFPQRDLHVRSVDPRILEATRPPLGGPPSDDSIDQAGGSV